MDCHRRGVLILTLFSLMISGGLSCPDYWMSFQGSCYALIRNHSPWAYADELCHDMQGYLVEINTPEENKFLSSLIKNSGLPDSRFWIGGHDLLAEGQWMWMHSDTPIEYTNWNPGNPSNSGNNENCMEMLRYGSNYGWNDNSCAVQLDFICERDLPLNPVIG